MKMISTLGAALLMAAVLSACGGGGDSTSGSSGTGSSSGSGSGSAGGTGTIFPYSRYDIYALYGTSTVPGSGPVTVVSATKGAVVFSSFGFRNALAGGELDITLGTGSVSLSAPILKATDLSWLAPGADGQLIQQCSAVSWDATGATVPAYPKSMATLVANTATPLARLTDIPAGTRLYVGEDCSFTGSNPTGDIAGAMRQANNNVVVNADGSLTVAPVGAAAFSVSAANVGAALAAGGTGIDMTLNAATGDTVPSTSGTGNYAMHAYSLPRTGAAPRYVIVVQATPPGGTTLSGREKGIVQMWVSP